MKRILLLGVLVLAGCTSDKPFNYCSMMYPTEVVINGNPDAGTVRNCIPSW